MSDSVFLTEAEVARLTGHTQRAAQIRWLRRKGYPHEINAKGEPVVCRDAVLPRQRGQEAETKEPRWEFVR